MTTVGFTRPSDRLEAGRELCRKYGLSCVCAPSMEPVHGSEETFSLVKKVFTDCDAYFTVFASITAVEECIKEFGKEMLLAYLEHTNVACTGESTAKALEEMVGRECDLVPETYSGECVAEEIKDEVGDKLVMLLRSDSGDDKIVKILENAGAYVVDAAVYGMIPAPVGPMHEELMQKIASGTINAMIFSSPMTVRTLYTQMSDKFGKNQADSYLNEVYKVAIGKPTSEAMEKLGIPADSMPEKSTFEGMLKTVAEYFSDTEN